MQQYQREFIKFCLDNDALRFGEFILKSKRKSPYFFNGGHFNSGAAYTKLCNFYAEAIIQEFIQHDYDMLFGPAYKGIILATCASIGLANKNINIPVCFNRKEVKDHGEGGMMIGNNITNKKMLLIDDVITSGITIRDSIDLVQPLNSAIVGIVIALDRQEIGLMSKISAVNEVEHEFKIKVKSIISRDNLLEYLAEPAHNLLEYLPAMIDYKNQYGIK